jgi:hypothetical protein
MEMKLESLLNGPTKLENRIEPKLNLGSLLNGPTKPNLKLNIRPIFNKKRKFLQRHQTKFIKRLNFNRNFMHKRRVKS